MKASNAIWKERFKGKLPEPLGSEVDQFETEIELRKQGKIDEKVFAETRLRRGAYGQRYDNGQRSDGVESRKLPFADKPTKGPGTMWDAPGMLRIKVPFGGLNPRQLEVMAEIAEEYSDGIAHVTTRQDFQLHFIHIENGPSIMRRLAAVGITTREACGNAVRNVTACPLSGVCRDEAFDVTPYSHALAWFLMGHPDTMEFGRKFKPAFSGCAQHACGLTQMHDIGFVAAVREVDGKLQRGFKIVVGGGLGPVPRQARLLTDFAPVEEMLPLTQAVCRVFGKHGEKKNRNAARIKFLVDKWGIEKFREEVFATRKELREDPRWLGMLQGIEQAAEGPLRPPGQLPAPGANPALAQWLRSNVRDQRQQGYVTAAVTLPLGDITADQLRALADIVAKYTRGTIRTTVEQNFLIRWISKADVAALHADLVAADLGQAGAESIVDVVSCPAPTPANSGSRPPAGWAASCATGCWRKATSWTRRSRACTSRSAAASTPAAAIMSPIWASTASAARSTATRCRTSKSCWAANGNTTPAPTGCRSSPFPPSGRPRSWTGSRGITCRTGARTRPSTASSSAWARGRSASCSSR